jgi:peroxiredoxin
MENTKQVPVYKEELKVLQANMASMAPKEVLDTFAKDAERMAKEFATPLKLKVGDKAPLFDLPNAINKNVSLHDLLNKGLVVLTFYRGTWCPFCNLALNAYQRILPHIKSLGANLVAISPQKPDYSLDMKQKNSLEFEVLSDVGNIVAKKYTTVFEISKEARETAAKLGLDYSVFYENKELNIPVPALFIIDKNGTIVFAKSEGGDYRIRVEPAEILVFLERYKINAI